MRGVIEAYGATDVGKKRDRNEDSFLIDRDLGLFVVADGMGGHAGGGVASKLAVETIHASLVEAKRAFPHAFQVAATLEEGAASLACPRRPRTIRMCSVDARSESQTACPLQVRSRPLEKR